MNQDPRKEVHSYDPRRRRPAVPSILDIDVGHHDRASGKHRGPTVRHVISPGIPARDIDKPHRYLCGTRILMNDDEEGWPRKQGSGLVCDESPEVEVGAWGEYQHTMDGDGDGQKGPDGQALRGIVSRSGQKTARTLARPGHPGYGSPHGPPPSRSSPKIVTSAP